MVAEPVFIAANWQQPGRVRALTTTRGGGFSGGPWTSFNLGANVGDDEVALRRNRELLAAQLSLPAEPQWLLQLHGTTLVEAGTDGMPHEGDAVYSDIPGRVCAVLSADCLPVVLADQAGTEIAIAHCGWRGLAAGILGQTVQRFRSPAEQLRAWLGPAISQQAFEVGDEVRSAFVAAQGSTAEGAFLHNHRGRWQADLYQLARNALGTLGVGAVSGGEHCTFAEPERFFSYRREGQTGRMATLAWIGI